MTLFYSFLCSNEKQLPLGTECSAGIQSGDRNQLSENTAKFSVVLPITRHFTKPQVMHVLLEVARRTFTEHFKFT